MNNIKKCTKCIDSWSGSVEADAGSLPAAAGTHWAGVATARCDQLTGSMQRWLLLSRSRQLTVICWLHVFSDLQDWSMQSRYSSSQPSYQRHVGTMLHDLCLFSLLVEFVGRSIGYVYCHTSRCFLLFRSYPRKGSHPPCSRVEKCSGNDPKYGTLKQATRTCSLDDSLSPSPKSNQASAAHTATQPY